jgi:S-adenosylmethionine synthetase
LIKDFVFYSESVTEGNSDKMSDIISDVILDDILKNDRDSKVDCNVALTKGICLVTGEVHTSTYSNIQELVRETIRDIGYSDASYGFDYRSVGIINVINDQSEEIYDYSNLDGLNADDMSVVYGYATDENKNYMPTSIDLANKISRELTNKRKDGTLSFLRPDGKVLVGVKYEDAMAVGIDSICISTQHATDVDLEILRESVKQEVIDEIVPKELIDKDTKYFINSSGSFTVGGPQVDSGMTGRKISNDTYGGVINSSTSSFSGKDPSKIDRSGSYMARYIAKNLVVAKIAKRVIVSLSFVAGAKNPVSISVSSFGTSKLSDEQIRSKIKSYFKLDISEIIEHLNLFSVKYADTSSYGHFGRDDKQFPWEDTKSSDKLLKYFL